MSTAARLARAFSLDPLHEELLDLALRRDGEAGARWRAVRERVDLDTFWDTRAIAFLPLVYRALVDEQVDDPDLPRLRGLYRKTWFDNQLRFHAVATPLRALRAEGVDAMVLKGAALANGVYRDVGLRPMFDCDLMVRTGQLGRALAVFDAAGWRPRAALPMNFARRFQEIDLFDGERHSIDLHWHLSQWLVAPGEEWTADDGFWDRSTEVEVGGAPTRALDPTDTLLHVVLHGARQGWRDAPQWVPDAVLLVRTDARIDWDRLVALTLRHGLALPVRPALRYLRERFAVEIPVEVIDALDVPTPARARRVIGRAAQAREPTAWERRLLGRHASTYRFWLTESATLDRRAAARALPGWLADYWRLDGSSRLPAAVVTRGTRRLLGLSRRRAR